MCIHVTPGGNTELKVLRTFLSIKVTVIKMLQDLLLPRGQILENTFQHDKKGLKMLPSVKEKKTLEPDTTKQKNKRSSKSASFKKQPAKGRSCNQDVFLCFYSCVAEDKK